MYIIRNRRLDIIVNVILVINSPLVTCLTSYECNNVILYFSSIKYQYGNYNKLIGIRIYLALIYFHGLTNPICSYKEWSIAGSV